VTLHRKKLLNTLATLKLFLSEHVDLMKNNRSVVPIVIDRERAIMAIRIVNGMRGTHYR
jgi:hypothetical protein